MAPLCQSLLLLTTALLCPRATAQGTLPPPPPGMEWKSLGIFLYSDSDSVSLDLSASTTANTPETTNVNQSLVVTTFDPTAGLPADQHIEILSSTYEVTLRGSGSAVVVNLQPSAETYSGSVALNNWQIGGDGSAGPVTTALTRGPGEASPVSGPGASVFSDSGSGFTSTFQLIEATGTAATDGSDLTFNLSGDFTIDVDGSSSLPQVFGNSSMFGDASVLTVYERFVLIPEPGVVMLLTVGLLLCGLRRRR